MAKTVTIDGFSLVTGARVSVKFTNGNSVNNPTLNVSTTGAKFIYIGTVQAIASDIVAGSIYDMVYDGTNYQLVTPPSESIVLTQAQYDSLSVGEQNNGKTYFISDAPDGDVNANLVSYSNTTSGLSATNIQEAVDELASEKLDTSNIALNFSALTTYSYGDRCIYLGIAYRYTNSTSTTGAWNASYWTTEPIGSSLKNIEYKTNYVVLNHTNPSTVSLNTVATGIYHLNAAIDFPYYSYTTPLSPNAGTVETFGDGTYKVQRFVYDSNTTETTLRNTVWERVKVNGTWQAWRCLAAKLVEGTCANLLSGGVVTWNANNNNILIQVNSYYGGALGANTEYGIATLPVASAISSTTTFQLVFGAASTTGIVYVVAGSTLLRLVPYVTIPANTYIRADLTYFI